MENETQAAKTALKLWDQFFTDKSFLPMCFEGKCMMPLLRKGDTLWIEHVRAEEVRAGDLVAIEAGPQWVVHRVLMKKKGKGEEVKILTKGDGVFQLDELVEPEKLAGLVTHRIRDGKKIKITTPVDRFFGFWAACFSMIEATVFTICLYLKNKTIGPTMIPNRVTEAVLGLLKLPVRICLRCYILVRGLQ